MKKEDQLNTLNGNVKCKLAPSKIHGVGVFAIRDINKGEKLFMFPNLKLNWFSLKLAELDKLFPEVKEMILAQWPAIINGSNFLAPYDSCWMLLYVNHSENQNYDFKTDMATKDIKTGEEITENYKEMIGWEQIHTWLK